jgi:hypothetical protein
VAVPASAACGVTRREAGRVIVSAGAACGEARSGVGGYSVRRSAGSVGRRGVRAFMGVACGGAPGVVGGS